MVMVARAGLAVAIACAVAFGCGQDKPQDPGSKMERATKELGEAARSGNVAQMGSAVKEMGSALSEGTRVEPVDFRELAKALPESIGALKKVMHEGSRSTIVGVASSSAQAVYEDGKGGRLAVEISDVGSMSGIASLALAWVAIDIDKEGSNGYEKTSNVGGRKAYERYSKRERMGEYDVIVAGRFKVSAKSQGLDMSTFKSALARIDLDKLESLRSAGLAKK
jgi:hypothetical protein